MRTALFLILVILPGIAGVVVFGMFALADYAALQAAYAQFERAAGGSHDLAALFIADARQNIHRINLFADGVWVLLSAIYAAIGLHAVLPAPPHERK